MEVTGAVFARMCGVSRATITILRKSGSSKIVVNSAGRIDTDNPVNRIYMEQHQAKMKTKLELCGMENAAHSYDSTLSASAVIPAMSVPATTEQSAGNFAATKKTNTSGTADELLKLPVGQLIRKYGSIDGVEKYSKILTNLTIAAEREQRLQERQMLQIPRDFVKTQLFAYIDQLMNQILDIPESISDQVIAVSLAGGDDVRMKVMHIISDNLTKCISGAKEHITNEMYALKGKYDRQDTVREIVAEQLENIQGAD